MDSLAAQVHPHAGAYGRDVIGSEQSDDRFEGVQHLLTRHGDLGVLRADEISGFLRIFEVDGIQVHADGERADLLAEKLGRDRADEAGIEAAGEQEAERRVRVEPLFHGGDQLFTDLLRDGVQIVA